MLRCAAGLATRALWPSGMASHHSAKAATLMKDITNSAPESCAHAPSPKKLKAEPAPTLRVKRLAKEAVLPKRGSAGAAGYDLARCCPAPYLGPHGSLTRSGEQQCCFPASALEHQQMGCV